MPVKKSTAKKTTAKRAATKDSKMKKIDYQVNIGIMPVIFTRGVVINDKSSNLSVELKLNHKKDLFTINAKVNNNQVTGDDMLDVAMLETHNELILEAIKYGVNWRNERLAAKEENADPDQLEMGLV